MMPVPSPGEEITVFIEALSAARFASDRPIPQLLFDSSDVRVVVFGFKAGQVMEPHTSTSTVLLQVLTGQGRIGIGDDDQVAAPGQVVICPPNVLHFMSAETDMTVLAVITPGL